MSSCTTSFAMLALAAIGVAGWQVSQTEPETSMHAEIPADPVLAMALPGAPALPVRLTDEPAWPDLMLPPELGANGMPCGLQISAEAAAPAMVHLTISDACRPLDQIALRHAGLTIGLLTDAQGGTQVSLPALSDPARVELYRGGVLIDATTLDIPDHDQYHRAALAWGGGAALALHAHAHGAEDGGTGHVHPASPGSPRDAILGRGGFLSALGSDPAGPAAQVFTYPRDATAGSGMIRLSVAVPCGEPIAAVRQESRADGQMVGAEMRITPPACGAASGQTRLQNLFQDLRIAGR